MTVHHIGYLVKNIEKAVDQFKKLGYDAYSGKSFDEFRKIAIVFLKKNSMVIELVSPISNESVIYGLLKHYKNSPYHICYESESFEEDLENLKQSGFTAIAEPAAAPAIENRKVVFLMSPVIGLIELLEA